MQLFSTPKFRTFLPASLALFSVVLFQAPGAAQETSSEADGSPSSNYANSSSARSSGGGFGLAAQLRIDTLQMFGGDNFGAISTPAGAPGGINNIAPATPIITVGFRLVDDKLFLGLGLSLAGGNAEDANGDGIGRFGFGLSPLVTYDFIRSAAAAFYGVAWFNMIRAGDSDPTDAPALNDGFWGIGLNAGAGIRAFITEAFAVATELGWGFTSVSVDDNSSLFLHGVFGVLMLEASVDL